MSVAERRPGRDHTEIERSSGIGAVVIRDSEAEARRAAAAMGHRNAGWEGPSLLGPPEVIAERLAPIVEAGFRTLYVDLPAPFDEETMVRLIAEVKPALERVPASGG